MNTIVVATNFSFVADNAVIYAANLAKAYQARLVIFNAFELPVHASNTLLPAHSVQALMDENLSLLKQKADTLADLYAIEIVYESIYSFVDLELTELVSKYKAAILIMGMSKKTIEQSLLGNTTTAAIRKLQFPVMAIPEQAIYKKFKRILYACDNLAELPHSLFSELIGLEQGQDTTVEKFHVDLKLKSLEKDSKNTITAEGATELDGGIMYYYKNVRSNAVIRAIELEIKNFNADLLVMVPRKHGFWDSVVHRSKTRVMASGLEIPLLSIPILTT